MLLTKTAATSWTTITLTNGDSIKVQLAAPSYEQTVAGFMTPDPAKSAILMLECVIGWGDVYQQNDSNENGDPAPVLFTRAALGLAIRQMPGLFDGLLRETRKLFEPLTGDAKKN